MLQRSSIFRAVGRHWWEHPTSIVCITTSRHEYTLGEDAATVILDGVKENKWRILIGPDAAALDRRVRDNPEKAYDGDFLPKRDDNHFTNPFSEKK